MPGRTGRTAGICPVADISYFVPLDCDVMGVVITAGCRYNSPRWITNPLDDYIRSVLQIEVCPMRRRTPDVGRVPRVRELFLPRCSARKVIGFWSFPEYFRVTTDPPAAGRAANLSFVVIGAVHSQVPNRRAGVPRSAALWTCGGTERAASPGVGIAAGGGANVISSRVGREQAEEKRPPATRKRMKCSDHNLSLQPSRAFLGSPVDLGKSFILWMLVRFKGISQLLCVKGYSRCTFRATSE